MIVRLVLGVLALAGCGRVLPTGSDGGSSANMHDDAGVSLPQSDAGVQIDGGFDSDGGAADAGASDAGHRRDAGVCPLSLYASAGELAKSPRANRVAELLIVESGQFVADDESYARVCADLPQLAVIDAGVFLARLLPEFLTGLSVTMDDAGIRDVASGAYFAWDCLNQTYEGEVTAASFGSGSAFVEFRKVVDVRSLVADYSRLPHVTGAAPESFGIPASCGFANDLCLDRDGGVFTYFGWVDGSHCDRSWFLLTSSADGGIYLQLRDAGMTADDWMDTFPACASRLWGHPHRFPDGGLK